ncbi:MAG: cytochrome P450 [Chloroflexota bacterium]
MSSPYAQYNDIHQYGRIIMQHGAAYVVGHEEARLVMGDQKRFIKDYRRLMSGSGANASPTMFDLLYDNMLMKDGDEHKRLRALISKAFTNRSVRALAPRIQVITDELIDGFQAKGAADFVEAFAYQLPIIVICELLGIPTADRDKFRTWSHAFIGISNDADPYGTSLFEFVEYIGRFIQLRRQNPQDDLTSRLIHAEENGERLTEQELFSMIALLIVAGHETTVNLISGGMLALLQHPDQAARLRRDPELIDNAIEEFLRYEGPIEMTTTRYAAADTTIGEVFLPRGTAVIVVLAAVNRDPDLFVNGGTLDVSRDAQQQMGFGYGVHYCVGAPLARLEASIAFNTLLQRLPTMRLAVAPEELQYTDSAVVRGLRQLPVVWE